MPSIYSIFRLGREAIVRQSSLRRVVQCYSGEEGSHLSTGAILSRPHTTDLWLPKVLAVVAGTIYLGGMISKQGAEFLEENEIFVPEED